MSRNGGEVRYEGEDGGQVLREIIIVDQHDFEWGNTGRDTQTTSWSKDERSDDQCERVVCNDFGVHPFADGGDATGEAGNGAGIVFLGDTRNDIPGLDIFTLALRHRSDESVIREVGR